MQMPIQRWLQEDNYFKILAGVATLVVVYLSLKPPGPDEKSWDFFLFRGDLILRKECNWPYCGDLFLRIRYSPYHDL